MWNELGISGGTAILILIALYYVIKWAVKTASKKLTVLSPERKPMKISKTKKSWKNLDRVQKINKSARAPGKEQRTKKPHKGDAFHGIQTFWQ